MNIGIVTTWFERGAAYVSKAYMEALQRQGHSVHIFARGGEEYAQGDPLWDLPNVTWGVRYKPLGRISRFDNLYISMIQFDLWLRNRDIEVIIFNEEHSFDTVRRVRKLGYTVGAYIDYYKKENVEHFREYDFLLCNTKRHYGVFQHLPGSLFIPWGTDINLFKPTNREHIVGTRHYVAFFHSAGFGGVNNRKGTDLVIKAFQRVKGNVKLILHSQVPLSKYGTDALEIVRNDPKIEFIEKTVPAPGLYHLGDVFVYPTRLEGIGLCVPEALACGLPVITTDNAPMNEFVKNGVNGLLVRVKETRMRKDGYYWPEKIADWKDLAEKMQRYVNDKDLLSRHKRQARETAETKLDWMKNAKELGSEIRVMMKNSHRKRRRPDMPKRIAWWTEAKYVEFLTYARRIAKQLLRNE
ncbi:MAG: glycosyltransferase family 4 protein [Methylobacter sp.]